MPSANKAGRAAAIFGLLGHHKWFVLAAAVLAGLGGWQVLRTVFGPEVIVDRVVRGSLVQTVVASGHVETPYRVEIGSQITGTVEEVLVDEGQRVKQGQTLIAIEASELKAAAVQAEGAVAQGEARMRQVRELSLPAANESVAQARATQFDAQQTFDRASTLIKTGFATKAALDDAQKNLDVARTQLRTAELQVFTNSPGGSDVVMAQTQLNQATANLQTARSRLGYATIVAPRDGVLISRSVERGVIAQPGRALMVLAPAGTTQLIVQIDEKNLGALALGQPAVNSADAYPNQTFPATVAYINPGVDITRASVEVKLDVRDPPDYLLQDMTISSDIEVARRDKALVLPLRDVHDALTGSPWVMVSKRGRAVQQPVSLGLHGNSAAEILSGLDEGDLAVPVTANLKTGQRLRPVAP